jgi:predicted outer membrane repeat protein
MMKPINLFIICLFLTVMVQGQIIHVPDDYSTIQIGINAANPGDTVLVAEGLYYEQINFLGKKPLMVASEFLIDNDASHITNTIIDGSQLTDADSASIVYFITGEDTTSVLCGFTIRNGKGTFIPDELGDWDSRVGGGIWIDGAGAKIIHNRITHNVLDDRQDPVVTNVNGAAIATPYVENNIWVVISDNTIDSNSVISNHYQASGAGIASSYSTRLENNIISDNICTGESEAVAVGSGLSLAGDGWENPLVMIVENNTIARNISQSGTMANSAGILIQLAQVMFSGNEVYENIVIDGMDIEFSGGGGMFLLNPLQGSVIRDNVFTGNISNRFSGGIHLKNFMPEAVPVLFENNFFKNNEAKYGGALASLDVPIILQNNVFSGNYAQESGGAIVLGDYESDNSGHFATINNNSFSGNTAESWGGAIYSPTNPKILILNSVFWADTAAMYPEISSSDTIEIAYSNINLNEVYGSIFDGGGNINLDPLFEDLELLTISAESPCINKGTESFTCQCGTIFTCPDFDINWVPRPLNDYVDMGAYETALTTIWDHPINTAPAFSIYPNPMADLLFVDYKTEKEAVVNITFYNTTGMKVKSLTLPKTGMGNQHFEINTQDLLPGIYFLSFQAGNEIRSGYVVKK